MRGFWRLVRSLVDAGKAQAVMGNHELNAIHFHTRGEDGQPLRAHSAKNLRQHAAFLAEFPEGAAQTRDAVAWMQSLPLFLEADGLRAVHACWDERMIASLRKQTRNGVLSEAQFHQAADKAHPLHALVETTTKGPEHPLPDGYSITDKDGTVRREVRLAWWKQADRWRDIAVSVPDPSDLPDAALPRAVQAQCYPADAPPVVFGHYWLTGTPVLQSQNALCLDYSAGKDGEPLVAYRADEPASAARSQSDRVGERIAPRSASPLGTP